MSRFALLASLALTKTLASFGTLQPANYDVDGIHVDFGEQCDVSSSEWLLSAETDTVWEDWPIKLDLSGDFQFSTWVSTVDVQLNGEKVYTELDMMMSFGDGDKYFSIAYDVDGAWNNADGQKGIQVYPNCGGSLASGDAATLLDDASSYDSRAHYALRYALAGGDLSNWEQMGGERHNNGDTMPVTIEVMNNHIDGEVTVKFVSATQELECVYNDEFASNTDLVVGITPDAESGEQDQVAMQWITVAKSEIDYCDGVCGASAHMDYTADSAHTSYGMDGPHTADVTADAWTIALSGKDLVIVALCAVMVLLMTFICMSLRMAGARRKYRVVSVAGDSEMEEFQK
jgi:hypothetical protein